MARPRGAPGHRRRTEDRARIPAAGEPGRGGTFRRASRDRRGPDPRRRLPRRSRGAGDASRPNLPDGEHWGTGEIVITSVDVLGADGEPTSVVGERSPMRIRIRYETEGSYEEPTFGIALHNEQGLHVTGTNTRLARRSTGTVCGSGTVEYHTESLPLLAGAYEISVAVEDQFSQHTFDRYDRAWQIRVRPEGEQEVYGLVDIGGDWTVTPGGT
ncbi:MAG: Wzt carbohydrate-binding domain-containing protein [Microthrixaceae bacterium]